MKTYGQHARIVAATIAILGMVVAVGLGDQEIANKSSRNRPNGGVSAGHTLDIEGLPALELSSEPSCAVRAAEQLNRPDSCNAEIIVTSEGNVGVGTSEPNGKFDVYGDIHFDNALRFRGEPSNYFVGIEPDTLVLNGWSVGLNVRGDNQDRALTLLTDRTALFEGNIHFNNALRFRGEPSNYFVQVQPDTLVMNGWELGFNVRGDNQERALSIHTDKTAEFEGQVRVPVLKITGGSDLAEPFDVNQTGETCESVVPGMVVVIDPDIPGELRLATEPYDQKVAGVISGANDLSPGMVMSAIGHEHADGEHPVALTGKVWVKCDASTAPIKPGDRLTTSSTSGHAMRALDRELSDGAVIGKAMTSLESGTGLVMVLVNLQ